MAAKYWTCRKCGYRNDRRYVKCRGIDARDGTLTYCTARRPPKHVPKHAVTLRDDSYAVYRELNELVHGAGDNCACCGRAPKDTRNMDRDHGHDKTEITFAKPRGLLCPGDYGCNRLMAKLSLVKARAIVAYLERVEAHYSHDA